VKHFNLGTVEERWDDTVASGTSEEDVDLVAAALLPRNIIFMFLVLISVRG
jgi:hypothetical protein